MKKYSIHKSNLAFGLIASLLSLNCLSEVTQPASAGQKTITYKSSLSEFKSINNDKDKLSVNDSALDMKGMDHSKMGADKMKDMEGMDHSKMSPEEMKNMEGMDHSKMGGEEMKNMDHSKMGADEMKGMDHSKMSADEMKDMKVAPKKSSKPTKVKKLKPNPLPKKPMPASEVKPTAPAPANPHQNHQM